MEDNIKNRQSSIVESFQSILGNEELLAKFIEFFPYQILIYAIDGTIVMVNQAMLKAFNFSDLDEVSGKFSNIFEDPFILKAGIMPLVRRAFRGEKIFLTDIKVPLEDISKIHKTNDADLEALYQDITFFPIMDADKKLSFIVAILINRRIYHGKNEIARAKEYIENHCMDSFDIKEAAKAAGLSRTHLVRLFKKHTGMTPHDYYIDLKICKIKEKLSDSNLSISQAFAACGVDYSGYFAKVFKDRVGFSPSQYRKTGNKK